MTAKVEGGLYESITGQIFEIGRQLRQKNGYPYDPEKLHKYLQDAIEGNFERAAPRGLPTWKTIKLGTYKTVSEFREALIANGFKLSEWGSSTLNKITIGPEETQVELVTATVSQLGFKDGGYYRAIMARIKELGFDLCLPEVGPQLRLQYPDQPEGEWLLIAMSPIAGSDDTLRVFNVVAIDEQRWLLGGFGSPGRFWHADAHWVFVRRDK